MNRKNFLKNKKINCIKVVIQILSFALIPGLFEGNSQLWEILFPAYTRKYFMGKCEVFVWMLLATVPATVLVGRFFCGFSAVLEQCRICYGLDHTDCGHYFREKET